MTKLRNIYAGHKAKFAGTYFENTLYHSASMQGFVVIKIPMGAKMISATKMIRIKTPFDFILWKKGRAIAIDAKSISTKSFSRSSITPHQLKDLLAVEATGSPAGYLVYFSTLDKVIFYAASKLKSIDQRGGGLKPECGLDCGSIRLVDLSKIIDQSSEPQALPPTHQFQSPE